jgi:hypothetical protein
MGNNPSQKAKDFFDLVKNESNHNHLLQRWPSGCTYNNWEETRIGPNGNLQKRTCRSVTDCDDPDYNHDTICEGWQDL